MTRTRTTVRRLADAVRELDRSTRGTAPTGLQAALTVLWLVVMVVASSVRTGHAQVPGIAFALAILGAWAPLLVRTWRPVLALAGTVLVESTILIFFAVPDPISRATSGMGAYQPVPLATMLAVATLTSRTPRRAGWAVGGVAGGVLAVIGLTVRSTDTSLTDLVVFYLVLTAAALGVWHSGRQERALRAARERAEHTQRAVLDERLRIARELHDVLAHNLTLVNAQAGVARYLMRTDVDAAERALRDITQHTGRAIDELRATVGLLRGREDEQRSGGSTGPDEDLSPVPGLGALDALVTSFRTAGADIALTSAGTPGALAQQADLAAYRIIQESLTNATKHAPGTTVEVGLTWTDAGVRLRVANPAPSDPDRPPVPGTGNGLIGMRERAAAAGGTLRAGPSPDGRFTVVATLPARPASPDDPDDPDDPDEPADPAATVGPPTPGDSRP